MTLSNSEHDHLFTHTQSANLAQISALLTAQGHLLATAESCTGGMIAAACTDMAGSSSWFERGFVTYSNESKTELLGVPEALIASQGAVSEGVARAMAQGALARSHAQASVAVTGIAGPGGATTGKPVGTVWMAWCVGGRTHSQVQRFDGDRTAVRTATVQYALAGLLAYLQDADPTGAAS